MKELTPKDWIERGYKRCEVYDKVINKSADFLLQKRFDDKKGKRYYITVYTYDRNKYPKDVPYPFSHWGFMPTVQFTQDGNLFFNIEINGAPTIEQTEEWAEKFWSLVGKPYYEEWE